MQQALRRHAATIPSLEEFEALLRQMPTTHDARSSATPVK